MRLKDNIQSQRNTSEDVEMGRTNVKMMDGFHYGGSGDSPPTQMRAEQQKTKSNSTVRKSEIVRISEAMKTINPIMGGDNDRSRS